MRWPRGRAPRTWPAGRPPPGRVAAPSAAGRRASARHGDARTGSSPRPASVAVTARGLLGRAGLQPVVDGDAAAAQPEPGRLERERGGQGERVRPARAGDQAPASPRRPGRPRPRRTGAAPGGSPRRPGAGPCPVTQVSARGRRRCRSSPPAEPSTRSSQACGAAISSLVGSVSGEVQTLLKVVHPGLVHDRPDERRALLVLLHLQVDAEDPPDRLLHPAGAEAPGR